MVPFNDFGDFNVRAKLKLFRVNKRFFRIALAAMSALSFPSGTGDMSANSYGNEWGIFFNGRYKHVNSDLSVNYILNGLFPIDDNQIVPGNEFSVNFSLSYTFPLGGKIGNYSIAPVFESSFTDVSQERLSDEIVPQTYEKVFFVSSGLKVTLHSFVIEGLLQYAVWEESGTELMPLKFKGLFGIRYMF